MGVGNLLRIAGLIIAILALAAAGQVSLNKSGTAERIAVAAFFVGGLFLVGFGAVICALAESHRRQNARLRIAERHARLKEPDSRKHRHAECRAMPLAETFPIWLFRRTVRLFSITMNFPATFVGTFIGIILEALLGYRNNGGAPDGIVGESSFEHEAGRHRVVWALRLVIMLAAVVFLMRKKW